MKFRGISDEIQMDFRGSQMVFRGFSEGIQGIFLGVSGGFPMKFQMDFRAVSGGSHIFFRKFSVPLNLLYGMHLKHKSPIVIVLCGLNIIQQNCQSWSSRRQMNC